MNNRTGFTIGCIALVLAWLSACSPRITQVSQFSGSRLVFEEEGVPLKQVHWSSSGRLVVVGQSVGTNSPIYLADANTGKMSRLSFEQEPATGMSPALSPSGKFVVFRDDSVQAIRILQIDTPYPHNWVLPQHGYATWSPDGQQLAVMDRESNTITIHLVDLQGRELAKVFELSDPRIEGLGNIDWSPDSERIAFSLIWESDVQNKDQGDIYVLSLESGIANRLTASPFESDDYPTWSPDGMRLIFSSTPVGHIASVVGQLVFANADGSCIKRVQSLQGVRSSSWSPDGTEIAVVSAGKIYIVDVTSLGEEFAAPQLTCP
jgi:Tol biopolymer transport system component